MNDMKFVSAALAVVMISVVLGLGLWLASHGNGIWLLVVGVAGFLGLFIRYGCQSH